jgi:RNase P subunit RPR2
LFIFEYRIGFESHRHNTQYHTMSIRYLNKSAYKGAQLISNVGTTSTAKSTPSASNPDAVGNIKRNANHLTKLLLAATANAEIPEFLKEHFAQEADMARTLTDSSMASKRTQERTDPAVGMFCEVCYALLLPGVSARKRIVKCNIAPKKVKGPRAPRSRGGNRDKSSMHNKQKVKYADTVVTQVKLTCLQCSHVTLLNGSTRRQKYATTLLSAAHNSGANKNKIKKNDRDPLLRGLTGLPGLPYSKTADSRLSRNALMEQQLSTKASTVRLKLQRVAAASAVSKRAIKPYETKNALFSQQCEDVNARNSKRSLLQPKPQGRNKRSRPNTTESQEKSEPSVVETKRGLYGLFGGTF